MSHKLQLRLAPWVLLAVAASWGFSFVVMKSALERQNVNSFLFSRFAVAVLVMLLFKPSVLKLINREMLTKGLITGLYLGSGYVLQTLGLTRTGVAVTGFITGLYVVTTPLIAAVVMRERISVFTWRCVALATIGLAVLPASLLFGLIASRVMLQSSNFTP